MNAPFSGVSIVITSYNYGRFLARTIASACAQQAEDLEIVVVDNASTDDSWTIVEGYAARDARLRAYRNPENIGMIGNHVRGLELATKDRVLFLSADDYLLPGHVARLVAAHGAYPDIDYFYTSYVHVDENDRFLRHLGHVGHLRGSYTGGRNEFADLLTHDCYMCTPTTLFDRRELLARGGFDPDIICGDYDTYLRLAAAGASFGFIDTVGAAIRIHAQEVSGRERFLATGKQFLEQLLLLERYLTEENLPKIAGREQGVANLLLAKANNLRTYPDVASQILPAAQPRVDLIFATLSRNRDKYLAAPLTKNAGISVVFEAAGDPLSVLATLEALSEQRYTDWNLVIAADGAIDFAPLFEDRARTLRSRLVVHRAPPNRATSLNDALSLASDEIIVYAEPGVRWPSDHLERIAAGFASAKIDALVVRAHLIAIRGDDVVTRIDDFAGSSVANRTAAVGEGIPLAAFAHRRSVIDRFGRFDERLQHLADFDFITRVFGSVNVRIDDESTVTIARPFDRPSPPLQDPRGYVAALQAIYNARPVQPETAARRRTHLQRIVSELNAIGAGSSPRDPIKFAEIARGLV
ncbi:MAG TPA: glycosyltransferase [Candidatus Baltobacteraceae bacterium]|nr:glycosyltransferase [Candidatus Baltobacteraceae bacterium]